MVAHSLVGYLVGYKPIKPRISSRHRIHRKELSPRGETPLLAKIFVMTSERRF